jgi:hypothetical protein
MMTRKQKIRIKERDGNKCKKCNSREQLTIDHVVPVALGGTDDDNNLQTLCRGCNVMKSDKPPKYRSLFNLFFSRKTIYEFKNEIRSNISSVKTLAKNDNERLRLDMVQEGFNTDKKIRDLEAKHKSYIDRLVKRIHYLEAYLKIEWVEETTEIKEYRKIKRKKK